MGKPRRGPASEQDWKGQHSQLGAVLNIKSRQTGFQGLPPSLRLLSLVKPRRLRRPQSQQPANHLTAGKFTALARALNSETGPPWLLGPAQRFHGAIRPKGGRSRRSGETASNGRRSQRCNSLLFIWLLQGAPALGPQEESQERAVLAGKAGPAPAVLHHHCPASRPPPGTPAESARWSFGKGQSH